MSSTQYRVRVLSVGNDCLELELLLRGDAERVHLHSSFV